MGATVAFNYPAWVAAFSEFASPGGPIPVTSAQAQGYFDVATGFFRNDGRGPCSSPTTQTRLLNLLTAHIAKLLAPPAGQAQASPLVGRISDASEGSVHVSVELPANMPTGSAFFTQTQYGLMFWQLSAVYRLGVYIPNDRNPVNAGAFGIGSLGGTNWLP